MGCIYKRGKTYWINYSRNGRPYFESSGSKKHEDAKRLLRLREGDIARGVPVTSQIGRMRFQEAADDLLTDYLVNKRRSYANVERRVRLGLEPFFSRSADDPHHHRGRPALRAGSARGGGRQREH